MATRYIQYEMSSLQKNYLYDLVEIVIGKKNKWVFKIKKDSNGKVTKHNATGG